MASASARGRGQVLVVEGDPSTCELLVEALTFEGYAALGAPDAVLGRRLAAQDGIDAVVLDLPPRSAAELCLLRFLTGNQGTRAVPVIVLSTSLKPLDEAEAALVAGVLQKPFDLDELLARVAAATAA